LQGRSQDFLKGVSDTSIELRKVGVWGAAPTTGSNQNAPGCYIFHVKLLVPEM